MWDRGTCIVTSSLSLGERSLVQARWRLPRTAHGSTDRVKSPYMPETRRDQAGTICRQGQVERRRAIAMSRLGPCEIGLRRRHGVASLRSIASVAVAGQILRPAVHNCRRRRSAPSCKGLATLVASSTHHACYVDPTLLPRIQFQHCHERHQGHKKFTDGKVHVNEGEPK